MTIYTITTISNITEKPGDFPRIGETRCIGFFEKFEDAKRAVERNLGDMHEFYYKYAVIEAVCEGLYGTDPLSHLFKWSDDKDGYEPVDQSTWPKHLEKCLRSTHLCGFGIG